MTPFRTSANACWHPRRVPRSRPTNFVRARSLRRVAAGSWSGPTPVTSKTLTGLAHSFDANQPQRFEPQSSPDITRWVASLVTTLKPGSASVCMREARFAVCPIGVYSTWPCAGLDRPHHDLSGVEVRPGSGVGGAPRSEQAQLLSQSVYLLPGCVARSKPHAADGPHERRARRTAQGCHHRSTAQRSRRSDGPRRSSSGARIDATRVFGIKILHQLGRALDIGEQRGNQFALALWHILGFYRGADAVSRSRYDWRRELSGVRYFCPRWSLALGGTTCVTESGTGTCGGPARGTSLWQSASTVVAKLRVVEVLCGTA